MFISKRRLIHALSYEIILLIIIAVALSIFLNMPLEVTGTLGIVMALTSVVWNMLFNYMFEKAEHKYKLKRTVFIRILHAIGFEGGLVLATTPMIAYALQVTLFEALALDITLTLCILVYTFVFQWCYDFIEQKMILKQQA
ncbi:chlorhexidine efflux PACE transporter AceI [Acinetobacter rathckeae]|uniref:chlorhexidine efflux PACE transporter AceI n=1 Tax=Acinetobacter rathckeae TaxID=2605272 RepID=UPI0018A2EBC5|nr:chlorhexidine efflux PACE transporter AceI [Acinetobacter rathckeae]MBF7687152.1 chlorhexidine efflux PACE transporter AceI [Acinetobacter rathckeae]MBF7694495.1 chlorhexidine efflux PACE transporter AceI [Acinetobacter rathckeae]